jgi:hypothetical protein
MQLFMSTNINKAVARIRLKSHSNAVDLQKTCGRCSKTIRMRDGLNALICTATLGVIDANFDDVCIHYEERGEIAELSFFGQPG